MGTTCKSCSVARVTCRNRLESAVWTISHPPPHQSVEHSQSTPIGCTSCAAESTIGSSRAMSKSTSVPTRTSNSMPEFPATSAAASFTGEVQSRACTVTGVWRVWDESRLRFPRPSFRPQLPSTRPLLRPQPRRSSSAPRPFSQDPAPPESNGMFRSTLCCRWCNAAACSVKTTRLIPAPYLASAMPSNPQPAPSSKTER
mmetsp:Transcript_35791/g.76411  ORF Transcript_35791/g.76411 Transcript_35791/m.76411 type:complete len:200 (+) Transcript_35791:429-1028(+)